jgi:integrase
MSSIAKRPDGQWRARYRDANQKEHSKHFARKVDAQRWLDAVTTSVQTGNYVDPSRSRMTVGTLSDEWLHAKVNLKPTTRALYISVLEVHVRPRWRNTRLIAVEHGAVQKWIADLTATGLSSGHVRKIHGVLFGVLSLAVRDRRLPSNPAAGVALPRVTQRSRRYLTAMQVESLAGAAGNGREAVLVLAYCGLRWSELAGLRAGRVDLAKGRLEIAEAMTEVDGILIFGTPKSHEHRSVPIPQFLIDELRRLIDGRSPDELVFTGARGAPLRNRNARRAWFNGAATAIGESGLVPHELRHTAASLAVSAGANVKAVQRMLGHASAAMTLDRYADLFDSDLDAVADRLDAVARAARATLADFLRTKAAEARIEDALETTTGPGFRDL